MSRLYFEILSMVYEQVGLIQTCLFWTKYNCILIWQNQGLEGYPILAQKGMNPLQTDSNTVIGEDTNIS